MAATGVVQFNVLLCMRELRKQGLLVWIIFGTTVFRTAISFLLIYGFNLGCISVVSGFLTYSYTYTFINVLVVYYSDWELLAQDEAFKHIMPVSYEEVEMVTPLVSNKNNQHLRKEIIDDDLIKDQVDQ